MFDQSSGGVDTALAAGPPRVLPTELGLFTGFLTAAPRGIAAGVLDVASVLSRRSVIGPPGSESHERDVLAQKRMEEGAKRIREFTTKRVAPEPSETGAASQILFGVSRLLTKAVPLTLAGGPVVGAVGTGAIEGMVETGRLEDKGVDPATATLAGTAKALSTGVQVALPLAGATKLGTAGLVVAGGPGGFIAEQSAMRWILENADYQKIGAQYDPLDPVGLAVSTLFATGFGVAGHVVRSRSRVTAEQEAAARVHQVADQVDSLALTTKDPEAYITHREALEAAARAIDAGEPVNVSLAGMNEIRVREAAADFLQAEIGAKEAREAAAAVPAFLRTAEDLIALRDSPERELPPAVRSALEIAQKPGFLRTAEERIQLEAMLAKRYQITDAEPVAPTAAAPRVEQPAAVPEAQPGAARGAEPKPEEQAQVQARAVAEKSPELLVPDEAGNLVPAKQLLDDADAQFQQHQVESRAYAAAVTCFLRA